MFASRDGGDALRPVILVIGACAAIGAFAARRMLDARVARREQAREVIDLRESTGEGEALLNRRRQRPEFVLELHTTTFDDEALHPTHEILNSRSTATRISDSA
jgi:hypothetical protein